MTSESPVWLITGAGSGFGHAIALEALSRSHRVIATSRRLPSLTPLFAAGASILELDVTATESVISAKVKESYDLYGRLDFLVNAAGYFLEGACEEANAAEVAALFDTNVFGTIKVIRAAIPFLRASSTPTAIANLGSAAGWFGYPAMGFYQSTKWAINGFSEALAGELASFGITVLSVEPGNVRTALLNPGKRVVAATQLDEHYGPDSITARMKKGLDAIDNNQQGDVKKGAKVIVDVLTKTGVAEGKEIPIRLVLGSDAVSVIRKKCEGTLKLLNEWEDIAASTNSSTSPDAGTAVLADKAGLPSQT